MNSFSQAGNQELPLTLFLQIRKLRHRENKVIFIYICKYRIQYIAYYYINYIKCTFVYLCVYGGLCVGVREQPVGVSCRLYREGPGLELMSSGSAANTFTCGASLWPLIRHFA